MKSFFMALCLAVPGVAFAAPVLHTVLKSSHQGGAAETTSEHGKGLMVRGFEACASAVALPSRVLAPLGVEYPSPPELGLPASKERVMLSKPVALSDHISIVGVNGELKDRRDFGRYSVEYTFNVPYALAIKEINSLYGTNIKVQDKSESVADTPVWRVWHTASGPSSVACNFQIR